MAYPVPRSTTSRRMLSRIQAVCGSSTRSRSTSISHRTRPRLSSMRTIGCGFTRTPRFANVVYASNTWIGVTEADPIAIEGTRAIGVRIPIR